MITRQLLAAATAAVAFVGSATFAQEATQFEVPPSTLTRAEVKAELARAIADRTYATNEASYTVQPSAGIQSRAEVHAEADNAKPLNVQLYLGE